MLCLVVVNLVMVVVGLALLGICCAIVVFVGDD